MVIKKEEVVIAHWRGVGGSRNQGFDCATLRSWRWIQPKLLQDCHYRDEKVKENNEYEYRVIATNEAGPSDPSIPTKPIPARPMKGGSAAV